MKLHQQGRIIHVMGTPSQARHSPEEDYMAPVFLLSFPRHEAHTLFLGAQGGV